MPAVQIAYLVRYAFLLLMAALAFAAICPAFRAWRHAVRRSMRPIPGYFLFMQPEDPINESGYDPIEYYNTDGYVGDDSVHPVDRSGAADFGTRRFNYRSLLTQPRVQERPLAGKGGSVRSLMLYQTTNIGSARSNDIRLDRKVSNRRQAVIYRFDGDWFIRPSGRRAVTYLNEEKVTKPTPLEHMDVINVGGWYFTFIDEAAAAYSAGVDYDPLAVSTEVLRQSWERQSQDAPLLRDDDSDRAGYEVGLDSGLRHQRYYPGLWLLSNLWYFLCCGMAYLLLPWRSHAEQEPLFIGAVAFAIAMNAVYLLLPLFLRGFDTLLISVIYVLAATGLLIQFRLTFLSQPLWLEAIKAGNIEEVRRINEVYVQEFMPQLWVAVIMTVTFIPVAALSARTRLLEFFAYVCMVLTPLLYIITLIWGTGDAAFGARLWLRIGGRTVQLTEVAKLTYLLVLASFFKVRPPLKIQLLFAGWALAVFFMIMMLPDLGSLMILLPLTIVVFVVMTSEYFKALVVLGMSALAGVAAWSLFPHVRARLHGWTTIWSEVNTSNSQIILALQAIGRGRLSGRGIGNGNPRSIPIVESDMVFAAIAEELGLIVGLCIVVLFFVFWLRGSTTSVLAPDGFSSALALGLGSLLFIEAVVVIAGTAGLIPLTGATLPFIAQGNSSLTVKFIMAGILLGLPARKRLLVGVKP